MRKKYTIHARIPAILKARYVTVTQAAKEFGKHRDTILGLTNRGCVRWKSLPKKRGGHTEKLIRYDDLVEFYN